MSTSNRREFLRMASRFTLLGLAVPLYSGCQTAVGTLADIGAATGTISGREAQAIKRSSEAVAKSFEDITPEQEYYIGRTVGAVVVDKYKPFNNRAATMYLNVLGQTLAMASDLPETFGGYHFLILDSDEINAFAAPGGLIFVSRGMLKCCQNEDAVAAVLAHEIGHVQEKHGLKAIKKARLTSALTTIAAEGAKTLGGADLAKVTEAFEDSISDITQTMVNNGYSRSSEREADKAAVTILRRVGYNPAGLVDMLSIMDKRLKPGGRDFAKTHPSPESRISDIKSMTGKTVEVSVPDARQNRFKKALGNV